LGFLIEAANFVIEMMKDYAQKLCGKGVHLSGNPMQDDWDYVK
jgi:hypothetical protein